MEALTAVNRPPHSQFTTWSKAVDQIGMEIGGLRVILHKSGGKSGRYDAEMISVDAALSTIFFRLWTTS